MRKEWGTDTLHFILFSLFSRVWDWKVGVALRFRVDDRVGENSI